MNMNINIKSNMVLRVLLLLGILLIILSAFFPIFTFDLEGLFDKIAAIAGPLLDYATDGLVDEESIKDFLSYAMGSETVDLIEHVETFSLLDIYSAKGLIEYISVDLSYEAWIMVSTICKVLGVVTYAIPVLVLVIAAVIIIKHKTTKFALGILDTTILFSTIYNIIFFWCFKAIENYILVEISQSFNIAVGNDIFHASIIPFAIFIVGAILCLVASNLLVNKEYDCKVVVKKTDPVITFIAGELKDAKIPLKDGIPQIIGRETENSNIVLSNDSTVSRIHCKIEYSKFDKKVYITDYSSNGTAIENGGRLQKNEKQPITSGTVIVLSPYTKFIVEY